MNRLTSCATWIVSLALVSLVWLSSPMPAQATSIIETFQFKATDKEWCRGNPRFFEAFNLKVTNGITMTITRDPLNTGDATNIQATINVVDATTLNGRAFPTNKSGRTAKLVLSGTNQNNPDEFLTIQGQATFDTGGNLIRVTGTLWDRGTDTCFDSMTFATNRFPFPGGDGRGGGTLAVSGPHIEGFHIGGPSVSNKARTQYSFETGTVVNISWFEGAPNALFLKEVSVSFDFTTNHITDITFISGPPHRSDLQIFWGCGDFLLLNPCPGGATINRLIGTLVLNQVVLPESTGFSPLTLNGTLTFTPLF